MIKKWLLNHWVWVVVGTLLVVVGIFLEGRIQDWLVALGVISSSTGLVRSFSRDAMKAFRKEEKAKLSKIAAEEKLRSKQREEEKKAAYAKIDREAKKEANAIITPEEAAEDANKLLDQLDPDFSDSDE
jgi:hypothetical protein